MQKTVLIAMAGLLSFGGLSLQASIVPVNFDFNTEGNSPDLIYDGPYAISPYNGSVAGMTVQLFCDDFNDSIPFGQQNITAYSTPLTAPAPALAGQTRFGVANPSSPPAAYPAGAQLYYEMAWLATQALNTSGANAIYNDIAIQEAIWTLTNDPNVDGASPQNKTTTQAGVYGDAGVEQSYLAWIADAASDYNITVDGYASLVAGDWSIITAVSSAGCTFGSGTAFSQNSGVSACIPGTAGTGDVTQEFLAYSPAPESASFFLAALGLLAGAIFAGFVPRNTLFNRLSLRR